MSKNIVNWQIFVVQITSQVGVEMIYGHSVMTGVWKGKTQGFFFLSCQPTGITSLMTQGNDRFILPNTKYLAFLVQQSQKPWSLETVTSSWVIFIILTCLRFIFRTDPQQLSPKIVIQLQSCRAIVFLSLLAFSYSCLFHSNVQINQN